MVPRHAAWMPILGTESKEIWVELVELADSGRILWVLTSMTRVEAITASQIFRVTGDFGSERIPVAGGN